MPTPNVPPTSIEASRPPRWGWMAALLLAFLLPRPAFAQNNGALMPYTPEQFFSATGAIANGAKLCTFAAGTTTPLATYSEQTLTTANSNPITLGATGRSANRIYITAASYKFILYAAVAGQPNVCPYNGTTIWSMDNVYDFGQLLAAGLVTVTSINNRQFCATGANFGAKFTAAAALLPSTGGIVDCSNLQGAQSIASDVFTGVTKPIRLLWPSGTVSSAVSLTQPAALTWDMGQAGVLSMAAATIATINGHIEGPRTTHFSGSGNIVIGNTGQPTYPEWWGAVPDNSTDSATAINTATTAAGQHGLVVIGPGQYAIGSTVTFKSDDQTVMMEGAILRPTFAGVAVRVGEDTTNHSRITLQGGRIARGSISWTPGNTGLQVSRVYNSQFIGQSFYGFEKAIQLTTPTNAETDQNYFNFKSIYNCKYGIYIYPTTTGAVNANVFTGGGQIQYTAGDPNYGTTYAIASSTNASPIAVTTALAHGLTTGATVIISGHTTNTNANGTWIVTVTGATTFTLNNSTGNGVGGATGSVDTGSYAVMMSKQNDANGNVNSNVIDNIYIANSNGAAVPQPWGLYINGAQNDFTQLHTEGFQLPTAVLGPDAGGVGAAAVKNPNNFWSLNADWLKAEDSLAATLYPYAQYTFTGRDGTSFANGGNSNSTYVLRLAQIGAATKDAFQVVDSSYRTAAQMKANGVLIVTEPVSGASVMIAPNSAGLYDVIDAGGSTSLPLRIRTNGAYRTEIGTNGTLTVITGDIINSAGVIRTSSTAGTIGTTAGTFAQLPGSPNAGDCKWITDSNTATYAAAVAGGGANAILACWDGANWRAH